MTAKPDRRAPLCPICGKAATELRYRPFCSARCKAVDLNRWLGGHYRIPSSESAGPADRPEAAELPDEE